MMSSLRGHSHASARLASRTLCGKVGEHMTLQASDALTRCQAFWWGVEIGPDCRFYGVPILRRAPDSAIRIGSSCRFRSLQSSNLVGLNHRCVVATLYPGAEITIGSEVGLSGTSVTAAQSVVVGNRVLCAANVTITDTDWHGLWPGAPGERRRAGAAAPVSIEDDVWL